MVKLSISTGPFSIARLNYQIIYYFDGDITSPIFICFGQKYTSSPNKSIHFSHKSWLVVTYPPKNMSQVG